MKNIFITAALLLVVFLGKSQESFFNNQVIVLLHGQFDIKEVLSDLEKELPEAKFQLNRVLSARAHVSLVEFNPDLLTVNKAMDILKQDDRVSLVQPNHNNIQKRTTIPNDLEYPVQWSLGSTATAKIFAPQAWDITTDDLTITGETIVMAVVDGGMELNHVDLNMFKNTHEIPNNGIDDDNNGYVDDYDGWNAYDHNGVIQQDDHGAHIAGIMAAKTNNTEGVAGIVWGGQILPISASSTDEAVVLEGYGYALELRSKYNETNGDSGAFIVCTNSSFGINFGDPADYPIWCAFYDTLGQAGILNLGATSNAGLDVDVDGDIPTTCPSDYMVAVSNINQNGNLLGGYGATQIDLAAPGTDIRSTVLNNTYAFKTGTSMATPHVAGVVGAMYSAMCGFDLEDALTRPDSLTLWVRQILLESVDTVSNLAGKNITSGRLNMYKAVTSVQTAQVESTIDRTHATDSSTPDGSIQVIPTGGTTPYEYLWSNGVTTDINPGLLPGVYTVTVTEKYKCQSIETTEIWTVGISEVTDNTFLIAPNPSNGIFEIHFANVTQNNHQLRAFDQVGKLIYQEVIPANSKRFTVNLEVAKGIYFIQIENENPTKVIVN